VSINISTYSVGLPSRRSESTMSSYHAKHSGFDSQRMNINKYGHTQDGRGQASLREGIHTGIGKRSFLSTGEKGVQETRRGEQSRQGLESTRGFEKR
jgi:hypothetical protein